MLKSRNVLICPLNAPVNSIKTERIYHFGHLLYGVELPVSTKSGMLIHTNKSLRLHAITAK